MIKSQEIISLHLKPLLDWYLYDIKLYLHKLNQDQGIRYPVKISEVYIPLQYDVLLLNKCLKETW